MADDPDRRRHQRAPFDFQVSLRFESVQQFLSACAGDISESGMFIRTAPGQHELGEMVALRFDAGKERVVHGTAKVVRLDASGVGVEFVDLDDTSRKVIEMIVRIKLAAG